MIERAYRATLFATYQLSIALGIVLLPLALRARQAGVTFPIHRVVDELGEAYESTQPS